MLWGNSEGSGAALHYRLHIHEKLVSGTIPGGDLKIFVVPSPPELWEACHNLPPAQPTSTSRPVTLP